jgi:hypothetical protein
MNLKPLLRHPNGNQQRLDDLTRTLFGGFSEFVLDDPPPERELQHLIRLNVENPPPRPAEPTRVPLPQYILDAIAAREEAAAAAAATTETVDQ